MGEISKSLHAIRNAFSEQGDATFHLFKRRNQRLIDNIVKAACTTRHTCPAIS